MSNARMNSLLTDKDVAISNIAGYSDKILYTCAPKDHRLIAIQRAQRGYGELVWSLKTSMSNMCLDRGPSRNYSSGLRKSSGSNTTRFVPNAPTSTGCDGISCSTTNATRRRWGQLRLRRF